ncbi:MAG TPA: hypothetical protein VMU50_20675, partial [Polyangia bacterium]|nr:hypothetical protein [Polyangia bacterium]
SAQDATSGIVTWRRQRPICTTSGTFRPAGTPASRKRPSVPVRAMVRGAPLRTHGSQVAPELNGVTGAVGTYTIAFKSGSACPKRAGVGASTMPLTLVVPPPGHSALVVTEVDEGTSAATSIWVEQDATNKALETSAAG